MISKPTVEDKKTQRASKQFFQIFPDERGKWRWHLRAGNGKIIATSGEGYKRRRACMHAVEMVREGALMAVVEML